MEVYDRREHAGVIAEIVHDDGPASPQENDNAGTIYSWTLDFAGDEQVRDPEDYAMYPFNELADWERWFKDEYDAALTIPLFFSDYGSRGARIYEMADGPNAALCFTQKEIDEEWGGHLDPYPVEMKGADGELTGEVREYGGARGYAKARIEELDQYLQGNVWGIVIREPSDEIEGEGTGLILESVWGFIGDPDAGYIREEADSMAEGAAEALQSEADEVAHWAARDVVTV